MTLQYIIKTLEEIALLQPNINSCGNGDIYNFINGNPQTKYSIFFVTQGTHREQNNIDYYNLNLFYLDRLTQDKKNNLRIQSTAKECLSNIIKSFCETFDVEVNNQINYTPFTETFSNDLCSGVYCNLTFEVIQETDCAEQYGEFVKPTIQVINNEDITITDNGTYFPQNGFSGFGKVEVNVSVDDYYNRGFEQGIAEQKSLIQPITITENGTYTNENGYSPINVNLDLESIYEEGVVNGKEEQKSLLENIKITENGVYDNENGFDVVDVEIDTQSYYDNGYNEGYSNGEVNGIEQGKEEQKSLLTSITITDNGNYTNENGYNEVIVNVGGTPKPKLPNGISLENSKFLSIDMNKQDWSNVYDWSYMFNNCSKLTEIQNFPTDVEILASAYMFQDCNNLTSVPELNTSNVTDMSNMFQDCNNLTSIPLLNTSNVISMSNMFQFCANLTSIPQINTSNCINMSYMFQNCSNLISIPQIDTSNCTDMRYMFADCRKLTSLPEIDFTNIENANSMFDGCYELVLDFNIKAPNLTNANGMFYRCQSLTNINFENTNNIKDAERMFKSCYELEYVNGLNFEKATSLSSCFEQCNKLIYIDDLKTSNTTNFYFIFDGCYLLKKVKINITKAENMQAMFGNCHNLEEIYFEGNPSYTNINLRDIFYRAGENIDNPKMYYPQEFQTNYQQIINMLPSKWTAIPY